MTQSRPDLAGSEQEQRGGGRGKRVEYHGRGGAGISDGCFMQVVPLPSCFVETRPVALTFLRD